MLDALQTLARYTTSWLPMRTGTALVPARPQ